MDFLKKHYEKVVLGVVLLGLAVAVAFLPLKIAGEKQKLDEMRTRLISRNVQPLTNLDLSLADAALKRAAVPATVDFSAPNKLFNPMLWQKTPEGRLLPPGPGRRATSSDQLLRSAKGDFEIVVAPSARAGIHSGAFTSMTRWVALPPGTTTSRPGRPPYGSRPLIANSNPRWARNGLLMVRVKRAVAPGRTVTRAGSIRTSRAAWT